MLIWVPGSSSSGSYARASRKSSRVKSCPDVSVTFEDAAMKTGLYSGELWASEVPALPVVPQPASGMTNSRASRMETMATASRDLRISRLLGVVMKVTVS